MGKKQIKVMDTSFRDGFQSVYGARVFVEDFIPAIKAAVDAGIRHFEVAGGARFQSPIFYCRENAFETMDKIRAAVGPDVNLRLQMSWVCRLQTDTTETLLPNRMVV